MLFFSYMKPIEILKEVRKHTKEVILFHSLSGKDSIMLIDLCSQIFEHVHCVYMHIVPDLEHMNRYKRFFLSCYNNVVFHEYEHWLLGAYRKIGHYGIKKDETARKNTLAKVMLRAQNQIGINWIILGSKQSDGLARRLQLKTYAHEAINYTYTKAYPLSKWTNRQVLAYIKANDLIAPLNYGNSKQQSQSNDVGDPIFLTWCKNNFPGDYRKITKMFPETEIILYRYENQNQAI